MRSFITASTVALGVLAGIAVANAEPGQPFADAPYWAQDALLPSDER